MRIDRYVHDERLTWGAAGVLLAVTAMHAGAIVRLFIMPPPAPVIEAPPPVFEISLQKLPPPRLPVETEPPPEPVDAARPPPDDIKPPPRQTRPVPILVDTPTENPVPPGTQVKPYEIGDELLPGVPGPPVTGGTPDGVGFDDSPGPKGPVYTQLKLVDFKKPVYPPHCLRLGIQGRVVVRALVGEDGRPQEVSVMKSSGDVTLDQSAIDAVKRWRFAPSLRNGTPVRAWVKVPVDFKLID
jgi:protein TonB